MKIIDKNKTMIKMMMNMMIIQIQKSLMSGMNMMYTHKKLPKILQNKMKMTKMKMYK